jgi:hypothetical protein
MVRSGPRRLIISLMSFVVINLSSIRSQWGQLEADRSTKPDRSSILTLAYIGRRGMRCNSDSYSKTQGSRFADSRRNSARRRSDHSSETSQSGSMTQNDDLTTKRATRYQTSRGSRGSQRRACHPRAGDSSQLNRSSDDQITNKQRLLLSTVQAHTPGRERGTENTSRSIPRALHRSANPCSISQSPPTSSTIRGQVMRDWPLAMRDHGPSSTSSAPGGEPRTNDAMRPCTTLGNSGSQTRSRRDQARARDDMNTGSGTSCMYQTQISFREPRFADGAHEWASDKGDRNQNQSIPLSGTCESNATRKSESSSVVPIRHNL